MTEAFDEADLTLAHVTSAPGGRHLEVTLMDGRKKVSVPLSGVVSFRGAVRTKTHLPNYMGVGDIVILYGAHARGKIPFALINEVRKCFARVSFPTPPGFFPEEHSGGDGWEFDREEQSMWAETMCGAAITAAKEMSGSEDSDSEVDVDAI